MTGKVRKEALEWLWWRAEYCYDQPCADAPSARTFKAMIKDEQAVEEVRDGQTWITLTDKGRRDLHDG